MTLEASPPNPQMELSDEMKRCLELSVSEATVKAHVSAVMQKLGVSNRTQAVLLAQKLALDHVAPDLTS